MTSRSLIEFGVRQVASTGALGCAVRDIRQARGMSQTELAERAGVSRFCLRDLETASRGVGTNNLMKVLDALGVVVQMHPFERATDLDRHIESLTADG